LQANVRVQQRLENLSCSTTDLYSRALEGGQGALDPLDFEIRHFSVTFLAKKVVFLVLRRKNQNSPHLVPPEKIFMATSGKIR